jgi:hypothetical protein
MEKNGKIAVMDETSSPRLSRDGVSKKSAGQGARRRIPTITKVITPGIISLMLASIAFNAMLLKHAGQKLFSRQLPLESEEEQNQVRFLEHLKSRREQNQRMEEYHQSRQHEIRSWGCGLTDTPFMFVHIGKAGGGTARARIAASSVNFTAIQGGGGWKDDAGAYYPVRNTSSEMGEVVQKARFCTSRHPQFRPLPERTFEKTIVCTASTPIGQALACPAPLGRLGDEQRHCAPDLMSDEAPVVYAGHNFLGNELHWLPPKILAKWWSQNWSPVVSDNAEE